MTVAERTRAAVDARPFLRDALAAGIVNYTAAAERLPVAADAEDDTDAVTAALRRYATELSRASPSGDARVRMERGLSLVDTNESGAETGDNGDASPLFRLGGVALVDDASGDLTAVLARGDVDARGLEHVLGRLRTAGVSVTAAGVGDGVLVVAVPDRAGATALRTVEDALS